MLPIRLVARRQLSRTVVARPATRSLLPQLTARTTSRSYASSHGDKPGSDLPWAVGAVIATAGGLYWALSPSSHGGGHHGDEHGDDSHDSHGHDDSHDKKEEKPAEEKEEPKEAKEEEEKPAEDDKSDDKKDSGDDSKGEDNKDQKKEDEKNPETPSKKA